jgi:6-phosphogluconolactonase
VRHELQIYETAEELATAAASFVASRVRDLEGREPDHRFTFALSGGKSPWLMFDQLAKLDVEWTATEIYQVDERVVPEDSDLRNLKSLRASLKGIDVTIFPMDVENDDLELATREYAAALPDRFDLIHLGVGPDGHCASLVPGDAVLEVTDRLVALSGPYQDTMRMTLTYPALERADQLLWLIAGEDKRDALAKLLAEDPTIPAGRVSAGASLIMADRAAAGPTP